VFDREQLLAMEAQEEDLDVLYSVAWFADRIDWDTVKPLFDYLETIRSKMGGRSTEK